MVATVPLSVSGPLSVSAVRVARGRLLSCSASSTYSSPFHPEVERAVESLYGVYREIDCRVAINSARTHAIACALFAILRPGDELLAVAGAPYDTLEEVIGIRGPSDSNINIGSLKDFGVRYREVPLAADGGLNWDALGCSVRPETRCVFIQRSCGYSWRKSLGFADIQRVISLTKGQNKDCIVMVDNCYGEFVETSEPPMVGADLIAGSLIKNPGGTIAPCGGYIAGRKGLVEAAAARLSAPGLGVDCGSTPGHVMRSLFQGLFLSPQMVGEALKGGLLIAEVMAARGYQVQPHPFGPRHDVVQAVQLGSRDKLIKFCEAVQRSCPIGSFIKPTAGSTPGYASEGALVSLFFYKI
ncbi:Methionine gamma-lyase [Carex littledalei]|uniref:Methionine gamma-lyase n=1 Tax=Carex littledalei TaxID=544730 RepID=A0A833RQQ8_9POAL|nr:Methionine gamma-lyase [Carex littledalei]